MNMQTLTLLSTIILQDTIFVKLSDVAEVFHPIVLQEETNDKDVKIVLIICATIAIVALIAKWAIWSWQKTKAEKEEKEREDKEKKDKEDAVRKQVSDLVTRKLELLQEFCYEIKGKEPKKIVKGLDSKEITKYTDTIDERLSLLDNTDKCQTT